MDRCERAFAYRKEGFNCAQAVAGAFADLTGLGPETLMNAVKGFGGGVGGSSEEVCGAVSGGVVVLSLLNSDPADPAGRKTVYPKAREFRRRFQEVFGRTRCGELRAARPGVSEKTPAAARLGASAHCDIMVITAAELLEEMLSEKNS